MEECLSISAPDVDAAGKLGGMIGLETVEKAVR